MHQLIPKLKYLSYLISKGGIENLTIASVFAAWASGDASYVTRQIFLRVAA
jgi:hypothetical protein